MLTEDQKKHVVIDLHAIGQRFIEKYGQLFGKDRMGYFFVSFDTGAHPTISFSTNARKHDQVRILECIIENIKADEVKLDQIN